MQIELEDAGPVEKKLSITVPVDTVDGELAKAFRELQKEVKLPGFRQGRAPRQLLEQRFFETVSADVAAELTSRSLDEALKEHDLTPVGTPEIDSGSLSTGQPFHFTARVAIRPQPRIESYEGLQVMGGEAEVRDEEIEELVDSMRRQRGSLEDVEERRPVADGDVVDTTITLSDESYGDLVREHQLISLPEDRDHGFLLDLLRGLEPGERGEAEVTVPQGYVQADWAGRACRAAVLVHEIKTLKLPALDDDFAKEMGHQTVAELRQELHRRILDSKGERARERQIRQLIEAIIERNPFEVPLTMVEDRAQTLVDSIAARLMAGMAEAMEATLDDLDEEKRGQVMEEASYSVRRELILEAVARQEGIRLEEEERDAHIEKLAGEAGQPPEMVQLLLRERNALTELEAKLLAEKTITWLLERARIDEE